MKFEELKGKSQDELKKLLVETKKELFNFRFQKVSGELEKTHNISEARKKVARINTLLTQKASGKETPAKEPKAKKPASKAKKTTKKAA
jgi:large subunit ribosomal protein L29